jgi:hypothetical protein
VMVNCLRLPSVYEKANSLSLFVPYLIYSFIAPMMTLKEKMLKVV